MKKKKLIFILALFAVIWNSCFDDLPYSRRQERNQKTTDDAISLNAVKKYYSHIPLLTLPQTQDKAKGGHGMNDSIDTAKDSTHVHTDACQHKHHTRGLPDIQESNIVPLWDEARKWSDSVSVYIEIPLNISGGKLYAHKTIKRKGKKTIFERVRPESMLVFEQRLGKKKTDCYMVTLIGEKDYMKKHGKKMKTMRHIPDNHAFTGIWYKSYPSGRIQSAYYYTNGKRTHKIFRAGCQQQSDYSKDNDFLSISLVDRSLSASSYSIDWENDVYYCAFCGLYHTYDGGGCEVLIEYCTRCGQNVDDCNCCYYCGNDPCTCNVCFVCGSDPCTCYSQCPDCGHDPCICCPDCRNFPCTCCPNCGNDPCICDDENTEPDNPDDCNGPKCPECGGLIMDGITTRASVSCPICDGKRCPVCEKRHCKEVHSNCDPIPASGKIKASANTMYNTMKNTYPDGPETFAFRDFENLLRTNGHNENSIGLSYYSDEEVYRLRELKTGNSPTSVKVTIFTTTVATIHNHPNGTPPSGIDFLNTAKWVSDNNVYSTTYVYTTNGNYALYIEDVQKAKLFYSKYSNCLSDTETKMFKAESDLDKKWESIYKELKGLSDTDRHMMSLAELAEQTNSGIRILKSEPSSSNSFGLYYTQTIDDKIIPYNCK